MPIERVEEIKLLEGRALGLVAVTGRDRRE
jgi:hypothetical protein